MPGAPPPEAAAAFWFVEDAKTVAEQVPEPPPVALKSPPEAVPPVAPVTVTVPVAAFEVVPPLPPLAVSEIPAPVTVVAPPAPPLPTPVTDVRPAPPAPRAIVKVSPASSHTVFRASPPPAPPVAQTRMMFDTVRLSVPKAPPPPPPIAVMRCQPATRAVHVRDVKIGSSIGKTIGISVTGSVSPAGSIRVRPSMRTSGRRSATYDTVIVSAGSKSISVADTATPTNCTTLPAALGAVAVVSPGEAADRYCRSPGVRLDSPVIRPSK